MKGKLRAGGVTAATMVAAMGFWASPAGAATDSFGAYWDSMPTVNGTATLVSASTTFVVPTINCSSGAALGMSFGLTDGSRYVQSIVQMVCNGTTPTYNFIVQVNKTVFTEGGVSAGDTVVASFYQTSTLAQATVHDLTSTYTWVAQGTPAPSTDVALGESPVFQLVNGSYTQLKVAPFGVTSFTKCQVNGDYLGFGDNLVHFSLASGGSVSVRTGALGASQDSFKLTFVHS